MLNLIVLIISLIGIDVIYLIYKTNRIEIDWFIFVVTILVCLNLILLL